MEKNKTNIQELRDLLFQTLVQLHEGKIAIEKVKEIVHLAQTLINLGKIEVEYMKISKSQGSKFFLAGDDVSIKEIDQYSDAMKRTVVSKLEKMKCEFPGLSLKECAEKLTETVSVDANTMLEWYKDIIR